MKILKLIIGLIIGIFGLLLIAFSVDTFDSNGIFLLTVSAVVFGTGAWLVHDSFKKQ
jgi:drug/metabolite transporter (DMT)-like permease